MAGFEVITEGHGTHPFRRGHPCEKRGRNNALWLACVASSLDVIDPLVAGGIDIDNQNDNGATCLMYAASAGKKDVAARLLAASANTKLKSLDGFTALDMASTIECLNLLRRK